MYRNRNSKAIPIIIILIIIIALIAGLVTVGRQLFGNNTQRSTQVEQQRASSEELLKVDGDRSMHMTVRGPIVADQNFHSYEIKVSPTTNTYTVYKGYLENIESTKSYDTNTAAYTQFVYALNQAAFTRPGKYTEEQASEMRGICATGNVYDFSIMKGNDVVKHYWTSTCKGSPGTLGANLTQVTNLFESQIPGLNDGFGTNSLSFL